MPDQMRKWIDIVKGWLGGKKATGNPPRTGGTGQGGSSSGSRKPDDDRA